MCLLQGAGGISHSQAVEKATTEYKKYQAKILSEAEKKLSGELESYRTESEKKVKYEN